MEINLLESNGKFCGAYLDNGVLLDARPGVGQALKENGFNPKTVLLTSMAGDASAGLDELVGVPISNTASIPDAKIEQFMVGSKGNRVYGYSIETPDGRLVYAPEFDRIEKSRLKGADVAILDPGDRSEDGELSGLSHRAYKARERMAVNSGVKDTIWIDGATGRVIQLGSVEKADGPNSDYLVIEAGKDGNQDKQHLRVKRDGTPDHNLMGAAWAALHGGYRGNVYEGPDKEGAISKLTALYKSEGMKTPGSAEKSIDLEQRIRDLSEAFDDYDFGLPIDTDDACIVATYDDSVIVCFMEMDDDESDDAADPEDASGGMGGMEDGSGDMGSMGMSSMPDCEMTYYQIGYTANADGTFTFDAPGSWTKVEPTQTYVATKSHVLVEKEQNGDRRWVAISSSEFRDGDGEIVSAQAMDFTIAVAKQRGNAGNLVWDHYNELPVGPCTSQMRVGKFLVEEGTFYKTAFAQKAADRLENAKPGEYRISLGFKYWPATRSHDGVFSYIDVYHRAITTHPANAATSVEVIKEMKTLTAEARKAIQADLGLTDEQMAEVLASTVEKEAPVPAENIREKEQPAETPAADAPVVANKESDELGALKTTVEALTASLKAAQDELAAAKAGIPALVQKELSGMFRDVASGQITRTTQSGAPVTEEEKKTIVTETAEKSGKAEGWDSFYARFTSKAS